MGGQKQWALVHHDHFENDHENWSDGSSFIQVSDANGDRFMGGHCNFAAGTMSKKYELPEHSHLRVQARAHFIDSWEGESAFLQLDDKTVGLNPWMLATARGSTLLVVTTLSTNGVMSLMWLCHTLLQLSSWNLAAPWTSTHVMNPLVWMM